MLAEPKCWTRQCKHYIGIHQPDGTEITERNVCNAFPEGTDGIPFRIAYGDNKHLRPLPDQDNDIVFEKATNEEWPP